jgi:hypothetical protein
MSEICRDCWDEFYWHFQLIRWLFCISGMINDILTQLKLYLDITRPSTNWRSSANGEDRYTYSATFYPSLTVIWKFERRLGIFWRNLAATKLYIIAMVDGRSDKSSATRRLTQRALRSCTNCSKRKVKCNKRLPCDVCTARGEASSCTREKVLTTRDTRR